MASKKLSLGIAAVLALSTLLSACGGGGSNDAATDTGKSGGDNAQVSTSPVKAKPDLKGKIRIGFVGLNEQTAPDPITGNKVYGADELKKWLKKDYPNVDFEIVTYPYQDHQAKAKALVESRQIDVSVESDSKFMWNQGLSEDLTPYMEKDKEWKKDLYLSSTLFEGPLEVEASGNHVNNALPIAVNGSGIYYDKKIFEDFGVDPLPAEPTWDQVLEAAKKLTGKNPKTGEETYGLFTRFPGDQGTFVVSMIANTYGADMGQMGPKEYDNKVTLNSDGMVKAAEFYKKLIPFGPQGMLQGQGGEKWGTKDNNIAIYINEPSGAMHLMKLKALGLSDRFDVAMIPKGPNGTGGFLGGVRVQMVKNAADKDLAWEITKWFSVGNGQKFLWDSKLMLPVSTVSLGEDYKSDPVATKAFQMAAQAQYMSPIWFTTAKFATTRALEKVLLNNVDAKTALDEAQKEVEAEFTKMRNADKK